MAVNCSNVLVVAHRGESFLAPENTLASFEHAWKNGDAAIELDIHLTKDGQVVVCHDASTFRTSGNAKRVVLQDATLAEIQNVDVGLIAGPRFAGQRCPTLTQVYDAMPPGRICFTEIKSGVDVVPAFAEVFRRSGKAAQQVVVISFHADALAASKKALPALKHCFLANYEQDKDTKQWLASPNVDEFIATARRIHADGLDLAAQPPLDEGACKKVLDAGLELHVWTTARPTMADSSVDLPSVARQYMSWGVKSITTNRSHWLCEQLFGKSMP